LTTESHVAGRTLVLRVERRVSGDAPERLFQFVAAKRSQR
jgi:hypothetical protein